MTIFAGGPPDTEPEPQHDRAPDDTASGSEENEHFEWGRSG